MTPDQYNRNQIETRVLTVNDHELLETALMTTDVYAQSWSMRAWAYQLLNGLTRDGKLGPATLAHLRGETSPTPPRPTDRFEVYQMYGDPENGVDGTEDLQWTSANIVSCHGTGEYPQLPGVPSVGPGRYVQVHREVEPVLRECLQLANRFSSYKIERLGCHNFRTISSTSYLSYRSWGIAFDVDGADNGRHQFPEGGEVEPWSAEWMAIWPAGVDREFVAAFESVGWTWGGRWRNADPMHFEWVG